MNEASDYPAEVNAVYESRRNAMVDGLARIGWEVERPKGTMFVWAPIPEAYRDMGSIEFATLLVTDCDVAVSPGVGFGPGGDGFVRFALIENEQRIVQAVRQLKRGLPEARLRPSQPRAGGETGWRAARRLGPCPTVPPSHAPARRTTSRRRSTTSTTPPHIGHAYTTVAGDVLTRWHRQRGEDVWFLTGTDEHGQKVLQAAEAQRRRARRSGPTGSSRPSGSRSSRPSTPPTTTSSAPPSSATPSGSGSSGRRSTTPGDVYEGSYEGPYCVACEEFKLPSELLEGEGDYAGQQALPDPRAARSRCSAEDNYFFRLSDYADQLLALLRRQPDVRPARVGAQRGALVRRSRACRTCRSPASPSTGASRCPWDDKHVLYVWIDALLNYATAVGLRRRPEPTSGSRGPGRPTCTSSARTSCGSTR